MLKDLTVAQVESLVEDFFEEEGYDYSEWRWVSNVTVPQLGEINIVETHGGGEGAGDHTHIVFKVERSNSASDREPRYFKKSGYYSSYEGTSWDGSFEEVTPVEKLMTVYERKNAK